MSKSKTLLGICFVSILGFLGLFAGTLAGALFVPDGSGLAGPAIALGYGAGGAIIGLILGTILARKLTYAQLRTALLGATIIALLACAWIVYRMRIVQQESAQRQIGSHTVALKFVLSRLV